jgi:hypothetical protein
MRYCERTRAAQCGSCPPWYERTDAERGARGPVGSTCRCRSVITATPSPQVPIQSLLTDEPPNQRQQPSHEGGVAPGALDVEEEDAEVEMAASCDRAAEDAAAPPPPPAAAAADGGDEGARGSAPSVAVLLAGVLEALLCEPKMADMQRTAAFMKRMAGTALLAGPGEAMALWAAIARCVPYCAGTVMGLHFLSGGPPEGLRRAFRLAWPKAQPSRRRRTVTCSSSTGTVI